jgi:hypothetical protein
MSNPSQDDIEKVKNNLDKMISFNKDVLTNANIKMENAFVLLTQTDNNDLGLQVGINLLGGCFWALGSLMGPLGNIPANFLSSLVSYYATSTPPSLNTTFSSLLIRLQNTILQTNADLATYYQDPVSNWDKTLSGSFKTPFGSYSASGKLSDLTTFDFPAQTDPSYYNILNGCVKSIDQGVWANLLTRFVITDYIESNPPMWDLPCDPNKIDNSFLKVNKSYYNVWTYHEDKDCYGNLVKYYHQEQYNIGTGSTVFTDGALADSACDYLFINYSSDIANKDGLFKRDFVFTSLGIPTANRYIDNGGHRRRSFFCPIRKRKTIKLTK